MGLESEFVNVDKPEYANYLVSFTIGKFIRQYYSWKIAGVVYRDYRSVVGGVDGARVEGRVEARTHREGGDGDG